MANDEVVDLDNDNIAQDQQAESATPDNTDKVGSKVKFFEKFDTEEEAKKAYKELERRLGEQGSELGRYRKELAQREQDSKLASVLERIATPKEEAKVFDIKSFAKQLAETDNQAEVTEKLLMVAGQWSREAEQAAEAKIAKLEKSYESRFAEFAEKFERVSPDYLEDKAMIDGFVEKYGVPLSKAKLMVKDFKQSFNIQQERITPPSSVSGSRVSGSGQTAKVYDDSDISRFKAEGLTDDDIKAMEADEIRRRKLHSKKVNIL